MLFNPKHFSSLILLVAIFACSLTSAQAIKMTAEESERGAIVRINGELFAEYLTRSGHQPAIWPIIGPTGEPMTRSFPMGPLLDTETDDHPHHHSLWFAHEAVNGHNFWLEPRPNQPPATANVIKHVEFVSISNKNDQAVLVTRNQWLAGQDLVSEDIREIIFGADELSRWIDFTITITATNGPVTFGDVKDGTFSVRVAGTMKVDSGGQIVNSVGQTNADAWGRPAEWVDYYGPLGDQTAGLAIFSHPDNFQHPCRWHVRNYGLFCANPFGNRQFPKSDIQQGKHTLAAGDSWQLRYRVFLHRGDPEQGEVAQAYRKFIGPSQDHPSLPLLFKDDFEQDLKHWHAADAKLPNSVWSLQSAQPSDQNHFLRVAGKSAYQPPHRSPHSVVLLKDHVVQDFVLTASVQNTNVNAGPHRDLCFFWGYQDPSHFYYAHLGAKPDPHSSQIFIVNEAPRKMITKNKSRGIPWQNGWHQVKIVRDTASGLLEVFFDDMNHPVLTAIDKTFSWGRVGLGTFDDHGNFDNVKLYGQIIQPLPASAQLP